jgi:chloramphenicol-sensitive protein RarD
VGDDRRNLEHDGLLFGVAAYGFWGVLPVYFRAVGGVAPTEFLAHRIVWSFLLLAAVLTLWRRWPELARTLRTRHTRSLLAVSALLIATNWLVYLHGVMTQRVIQTSLGYFINPLVSVVLGVVFFRERLRGGQWLAVALAAAGVAYYVLAGREWPWIALVLAGSFGLYGLVRKAAPVEALVGLSAETLLLFPAAAGFLGYWQSQGTLGFGSRGGWLDALLLLSGVVTTVPLLCFGAAARRLPLSTLGFLQYLAPTLQLLLAVTLFGEPFRPDQRWSFGLVWAALALFTAESVVSRRVMSAAVRAPDGAGRPAESSPPPAA